MTISNAALYANAPFHHAVIFAVPAVVGFIASVVFIVRADARKQITQTTSKILLGLWILGPPLWFFYEHFYYFPAYGNMCEGAGFEKLKAAQDVTAKVWAAFAVVIGALYNRKFPATS